MLFRRTILSRIQQLDPEADHQQIVKLTFCHEFPWDGTKSLEFALFRTFAVPSIGGLLDATGEFRYQTQKRYDDTDLLINAWIENGYESEAGKRAIRQMNRIHSHFNISNADYLYVLSTFICEPIRWIQRFGWRRMCEVEMQACYVFWREVAKRMAIRDVPPSLDAMESFNIDYERAHFRYNGASRRVASATRDLILRWYLPAPLRRLGEPAVYALMDEPLLDAFGFPKPSFATRRVVEGLLRLRARGLRFMPERREPKRHSNRGGKTYPDGYEIECLGARPPSNLPTRYRKSSPAPK